MSISVLVNGAFGRMGQITVKAISENANLSLAGQTGREYDLQKAIRDTKADVVVDFTHPEAVFKNTLAIIEAGARPVVGTSGLTKDQVKQLEKKCAELKRGGIIAPNFSLGAVLMMKYAKKIAKYMPQIEIIEMHHPQKIDSPSSTAMRSAELLADAIQNPLEPAPSKETIIGSRGANHQGIPIHAIRLPGILAAQQIIFGNIGETLSLSHNTIDRQCYMAGICLACEKVMKLDHLVHGLEEVI